MNFELTEKQKIFKRELRQFLEKELAPIVEEIEERKEFPIDFFKKMGKQGYLGISNFKKYGGQEADTISSVILVEEIARIHSGVSACIWITTMNGPLTILSGGTEEQKEKYVRAISTGEKIVSFGLTEPDAGSDLSNIATKAIREGDYYIINGGKTFITNGTIADIFYILARTYSNHGGSHLQIFLIEKGTPGLTVSRKIEKLGATPPDIAEISLEDVRVPISSLLGQEGSGLALAFKSVGFARTLATANALGLAQAVLESCTEFSKKRDKLGRSISMHQGVRSALAKMAVEVEAARLLVYQSAWMVGQGLRNWKETSMAKYYTTELVKRITREALQIHGVDGLTNKSPVGRYFRDAPMFSIVDGTSEIQLEIISRELGIVDKKEIRI